MKIAIIAPSPVPFTIGGAEKLWWGMLLHLNQYSGVQVELIKVPSPENDFWALMDSYRTFSELDLTHFDRVISTKYPAWMVKHHDHHCYLQHRLRGLYDTYHFSGCPEELETDEQALMPLVSLLDTRNPTHEQLPEFWRVLVETRADVPADRFAFPGPLTRKIVHYLDSIALAPGTIKRFSAISHNVANRRDYFPPGVEVKVSHHPSDISGLKSVAYDNFFTISRLDHPKRIALLIEAFMKTQGDVEFRIAGTGPEEANLRALAKPDPRIKFLGRITDAQVLEEYAQARCVPFIPYDEDYGLITIEAMQAAKPVITAEDSGGSNEFVKSDVNGYSVPTTADALAEAMQRLIDDKALAQTLGHNAAETVAYINWDNTLQMFLEEAPVERETYSNRPKVVIALNFTVWPPMGGGQSRVYALYREVAKVADVTIVAQGDHYSKKQLLPGMIEISVPKSTEQHAADLELDQRLNASVADIAVIENYKLSPEYLNTLKAEAAAADLVIASHPYLYYAIRDVYQGDIWYEAHNVELDMKTSVVGTDSSDAQHYLAVVEQVERRCCDDAQQVLVCSEEDANRLASLYAIAEDKFVLVPNGVALETRHFQPYAERLRLKSRIGLEGRFVTLFMGSWHGPNIEAVESIIEIAQQSPSVDFMIFGSVCNHEVCNHLPDNIYPLGLLEEGDKAVWMSCADAAINPMMSGSGTNLKMLDYSAAGLPIITTPFGNRGLGFCGETEVYVAELADFTEIIDAVRKNPETAARAAEKAYSRTQRSFDWMVIAQVVQEKILSLKV